MITLNKEIQFIKLNPSTTSALYNIPFNNFLPAYSCCFSLVPQWLKRMPCSLDRPYYLFKDSLEVCHHFSSPPRLAPTLKERNNLIVRVGRCEGVQRCAGAGV